jgi:hypothetical protein
LKGTPLFYSAPRVPTCKEMARKEEELGFMVKNEIGDKKNYPKYDSYRLAFGMIDDALKCGCPLQAITIEESILTDRLSSTLNVGISKGKPYKTLGSVLNAWRPKNKNKQPHSNAKLFDLEMNNLYERLDKWREARNLLLHGLVNLFKEIDQKLLLRILLKLQQSRLKKVCF